MKKNNLFSLGKVKLTYIYILNRLPLILLYILIILPFFLVINLNNISDDLFYYPLRIGFFFILIFEFYSAYKTYNLYLKAKTLSSNGGFNKDFKISKNGFDDLIYTELIKSNIEEYSKELKLYKDQHLNTLEYFDLWAHQIKTPLFALRLLLNSDAPFDKNSSLIKLTSIERYVDMAIKYLEIGDFNRDLRIEKIKLEDAIKSALKPFSRAFALKKIRLDYSFAGEIVISDLKWLEFAISQIISNAVKYSEESSTISITILKQANGKSGKTILKISDNGIGILPEDLPRIFEKGFTGKNGRDISNSTGIGLYVCKKVLDKLGHKIIIESTFGSGTDVTIFFDE